MSGIDEITWLQAIRSLDPSRATVTATAFPPSTCTRVAVVAIRTSPPRSATCSAHRSHIIPGPYFGYWNSSIRLVTWLAAVAATAE